MRRYTKEELRNLRRELIYRKGLTPEEATARIGELLKFTEEQHIKSNFTTFLARGEQQQDV